MPIKIKGAIGATKPKSSPSSWSLISLYSDPYNFPVWCTKRFIIKNIKQPIEKINPKVHDILKYENKVSIFITVPLN